MSEIGQSGCLKTYCILSDVMTKHTGRIKKQRRPNLLAHDRYRLVILHTVYREFPTLEFKHNGDL